ncbi:MAG TPA: ribosome assembly cofactor RimP [Bacteroidia bacterium]|nr:ribosome assembly cofactor RimP [Bacteroidia bacterium]HNU34007.1 ribosome assembly cofactor RimP [Bacteroidia bacterium]
MDTEQIKQLVGKKLLGTDQFLVDVKLSLNRIAVMIDKPTGITIDECALISRYLSEQLESSGLLETHELEVGSPGMDQPLKVYRQYLRRIGNRLRIITHDGKLHNGVLKAASENSFTVLETIINKEGNKKIKTEEEIVYDYSQVKEAKVEVVFSKL